MRLLGLEAVAGAFLVPGLSSLGQRGHKVVDFIAPRRDRPATQGLAGHQRGKLFVPKGDWTVNSHVFGSVGAKEISKLEVH